MSKTFNIIKGIEHLKDGKCIRRTTWINPKEHWKMTDGEIRVITNIEQPQPYLLDYIDNENTWEIYDELPDGLYYWDGKFFIFNGSEFLYYCYGWQTTDLGCSDTPKGKQDCKLIQVGCFDYNSQIGIVED